MLYNRCILPCPCPTIILYTCTINHSPDINSSAMDHGLGRVVGAVGGSVCFGHWEVMSKCRGRGSFKGCEAGWGWGGDAKYEKRFRL